MRKKWIVKDSFPDPKIAEAYLSPHVNTSKEKFHFESPKLFKIKNYVSRTLGWTEEEVVIAVLCFLSCILDCSENYTSNSTIY